MHYEYSLIGRTITQEAIKFPIITTTNNFIRGENLAKIMKLYGVITCF